MIRIFREVSEKFAIVADEYELDDLSDLDELVQRDQKRLSYLSITSQEPSLRVVFSATESEVIAEEPALNIIGAMRTIQEVAEARVRRWAPAQAVLLTVLTGFTTAAISVFSVRLDVKVDSVRRAILLTENRGDAPTFWQEKRSDIAIHITVGLFFFVLGIVVAKLYP